MQSFNLYLSEYDQCSGFGCDDSLPDHYQFLDLGHDNSIIDVPSDESPVSDLLNITDDDFLGIEYEYQNFPNDSRSFISFNAQPLTKSLMLIL